MAHHLLAICFDFGDTLIDQATEIKDERWVTQRAEFIPGAQEMLRELKARGYRLAIVSNGPVGNVDNVLSQAGLLELFDTVAISDALNLHKPDPALFHWAFERMGIRPEDHHRTVMVGNHLDRDVKGANDTGMISVWLSWSPRYPRIPICAGEVPDYTIQTPLELIPLVEHLDHGGGPARKPAVLIHHSANRGRRHPPGSLPGLADCLAAGARIVEVDLCATADGDFCLFHGPLLDDDTTGTGPLGARTSAELARLHHVWRGQDTGIPLGFLDEALDLLRAHPGLFELQLDLKPEGPVTPRALERLAHRLDGAKERVRVTSGGDWLLRRLHAENPGLPLGFDPLFYLDVHRGEEVWEETPRRRGAYGYMDVHPLASQRWGTAADYLAARAEGLSALAPGCGVWYIAADLLAQSLDDGFDWLAFLHAQQIEVTAWTLDPDRPRAVELARRLLAQGVDRITTNDPPSMAQVLGGGIEF